ncbi:hypothetical protein KUV26_20720 [Leisingera daeponensis]|uniref:Uncharacterized protein n=1 Tax=Leisingera daeponensis TaxID=405746 RepID=A0ABS7NKZ0_9RHOB|nr:hypothetical protein [Leisingera daeponensis]MBY6141867.1 hypothetical protein [Leisingera daeponensis]
MKGERNTEALGASWNRALNPFSEILRSFGRGVSRLRAAPSERGVVLRFQNRCTLPEWPGCLPQGSTKNYADAAFPLLRALASRKPAAPPQNRCRSAEEEAVIQEVRSKPADMKL